MQIRHWMTELSFVVCFGTFFVKVWRLYKMFFNKHLTKRVRDIRSIHRYNVLILICNILEIFKGSTSVGYDNDHSSSNSVDFDNTSSSLSSDTTYEH